MPYKDPIKAAECAKRYRQSIKRRASQKKRNYNFRSNPDNFEKLKKWGAEYRASEHGKFVIRKHLLKKYTLSHETYALLLEKQNNLCLFCGRPPHEGVNFDVEHDHSCCDSVTSCGKCIRGLVHHGCNGVIAMVETKFEKYKEYLEKSKTLMGK